MGGYRIHFLAPVTTAFHAEVLFGSTWNEEPERAGPRISHLGGGGAKTGRAGLGVRHQRGVADREQAARRID